MRKDNSVNGTSVDRGASLGRNTHGEQVVSDRQQATALRNKNQFNIATWNVRTLFQAGKFENLKQESMKFDIDILGIAETRWTGVDSFTSDEFTMINSGGTKHERGVGMLVKKKVAKAIIGYWAISDRVLMVKFNAKPFNMNILQVYAPTTDACDEEVEQFYEEINIGLKQCKSQELTFVMGDFNAKVGCGKSGSIVGPHGLGDRNERGDRIIQWCEENKYIITNTWYKKHKRRLWTWQQPGERAKNQIDFILTQQRFRNCVKKIGTIPSADCNSDHRPVKATIRVKLKILQKKQTQPKFDLDALQNKNIKEKYTIEVQNRYEAFNYLEEGEKDWSKLIECFTDPLEETVPRKVVKSKQKWMTQEILNLMEERRKYKRDEAAYKTINATIKSKCRIAKEDWIDERCIRLNSYHNKNSHVFYEALREISGKKKPPRSNCIQDKNGNILMETKDILNRWADYVRELYADPNRKEQATFVSGQDQGMPILEDEVESAVKEMKKGKAVGDDGIAIEMIQALGDMGTKILTKQLNKIYEAGKLPLELCQSTFITLPKKPGTTECGQHRTISIMSQITKVLLRIILKRIRNKITPLIGREQFGFMKDKGTTNAIYALKMIMERSIEKCNDLYICFIDYSKAFDSVHHDTLFDLLLKSNIDQRDFNVIHDLYLNQKARVRINGETSNQFDIQKGVRQGCVLSPELFNLYSEDIFSNINHLSGLSINGENITNIRYADDTALLANSQEDLQALVDRTTKESEARGLFLNVKKTECMLVSKKPASENMMDLTCKGSPIKQVDKFKYLGRILTQDAKDITAIKVQIAKAKQVFASLRHLLVNGYLSMHKKLQLINTFVYSTLLYGCETWTINKEAEKKIEALEMWIYRRMLKIPWTAKITNNEVIRRIGRDKCLLNNIRTRQMKFFGHVTRHNTLEKLVTSGQFRGTRSKGRQRTTYVTALRKTTTELDHNWQLVRAAEDREEWRLMIGNVLRRQAKDK